MKLSDKELPKYRFPSSDSSYGVRSYIIINRSIGNIEPGIYYFHPIEYALCKIESESIVTNNKMGLLSIQFMAYMPAIRPLYGDFATKSAYIEMGHMLGLLIYFLNDLGVPYTIDITDDSNIVDEQLMLGTLHIASGEYLVPYTGLTFNLLKHDYEKCAYLNKSGEHVIELDYDSIYSDTKDFQRTHVLEIANTLISIDYNSKMQEPSDILARNTSLVEGCIIAQKISETLYNHNIGSCMLGITPYPEGVYSMVVGGISEEEKLLAETQIKSYSCIRNDK